MAFYVLRNLKPLNRGQNKKEPIIIFKHSLDDINTENVESHSTKFRHELALLY